MWVNTRATFDKSEIDITFSEANEIPNYFIDFQGFNIEVISVVGMIGAGMKREVIISMCLPLICYKPAYKMRTFGHG